MLKTVVIVGASKGIGAELMESFASIDGFRVFGFARSMQLQREKWSLNPLVHCLDIDLTSENLQLQILDVLKNEKVDFLINNAGLLVNKPFMELTPSDILESYKVNVLSDSFKRSLNTVVEKVCSLGLIFVGDKVTKLDLADGILAIYRSTKSLACAISATPVNTIRSCAGLA